MYTDSNRPTQVPAQYHNQQIFYFKMFLQTHFHKLRLDEIGPIFYQKPENVESLIFFKHKNCG